MSGDGTDGPDERDADTSTDGSAPDGTDDGSAPDGADIPTDDGSGASPGDGSGDPGPDEATGGPESDDTAAQREAGNAPSDWSPPDGDEPAEFGADPDPDGAGGDPWDGTGDESGGPDAPEPETWKPDPPQPGEAEADQADTVSDGGAYDVESVDPYSGPGTTGSGPTPGAPDDEEMPLADHIEEMIRRLAVVVVVAGLVSAVVFPFGERLINFLWYSFLPGSTVVCPVAVNPDPAYPYSVVPTSDAACPYVYHPLALMFARVKVASMVGLIVALPVLVYESYLFMRPGLYPRERKYYLASVPTSLVLALVGVTFAYLLVLPTLFIYFTGYTDQAAEVAFGLTETFNLIVMMMGFFALVFQIPLLIMLAVMMGVTSRRWLADRRLYFYGGFATVAFLFSPDPTGMAPILVAVTMILLFEGTLLILRWTGDDSPVPTADGLAARRPAVYPLVLLGGYLTSTAPVPGGYYDDLPGLVTSGLASLGLTRATPLIVGLALVVGYELLAYAARRREADRRVRRVLARGRALAWPLALVVGYFGSPDPVLVTRVRGLAFGPLEVALVVGALVALYELTIVVLARRETA